MRFRFLCFFAGFFMSSFVLNIFRVYILFLLCAIVILLISSVKYATKRLFDDDM